MQRLTDFFQKLSPRKKAPKRRQSEIDEGPVAMPQGVQGGVGSLDPWSPAAVEPADGNELADLWSPEDGGYGLGLEEGGVAEGNIFDDLNLDGVLDEFLQQQTEGPSVAPTNNSLVGFLDMGELEGVLGEPDCAVPPVQPIQPSDDPCGPIPAPIPMASKARRQAAAKLSPREQLQAAPGKLEWQKATKSQWEKDFPWNKIQANSSNPKRAKMFCTLCQKHKKDTLFAVGGSVKFTTSALTDHAKSRAHTTAVLQEKSAVVMVKAVQEGASKSERAALNLFKAAYLVAKEDLALVKFSKLLDLLKDCGCPDIPSELYSNDKAAKNLINACAEAILDAQRDALQGSPVVAVGVDESTDISTNENMILYGKYLDGNKEVRWCSVMLIDY